jgi:DNA-binding transcriptional ArsR family regulator
MAYKIDDVFSALADQNRRAILLMLSDKKMTVNSIAENGQKGRERFYQLNVEPLNEVRNWLKFYDKFWDDKLNSLKNYLEAD